MLPDPTAIASLDRDAFLAERSRVVAALAAANAVGLAWLHVDLSAELERRLRDGRLSVTDVLEYAR